MILIPEEAEVGASQAGRVKGSTIPMTRIETGLVAITGTRIIEDNASWTRRREVYNSR